MFARLSDIIHPLCGMVRSEELVGRRRKPPHLYISLASQIRTVPARAVYSDPVRKSIWTVRVFAGAFKNAPDAVVNDAYFADTASERVMG